MPPEVMSPLLPAPRLGEFTTPYDLKMPGFRQQRCLSVRKALRCRPTNARKGLELTMVNSPPLKLADDIRMGRSWTKSQWLPRYLMVRYYAYATFCAVAASRIRSHEPTLGPDHSRVMGKAMRDAATLLA